MGEWLWYCELSIRDDDKDVDDDDNDADDDMLSIADVDRQ